MTFSGFPAQESALVEHPERCLVSEAENLGQIGQICRFMLRSAPDS